MLGTAGDPTRCRGANFGPLARYVRDPFPALSHWVGTGLAIWGTVLLLRVRPLQPAEWVALLVYGLSLVVLFAASAYAHTARCSPESSMRLVKIDYAAIFLLIAGTYTPVCVLAIRGGTGAAILAVEWVIGAVGTWFVLTGWRGRKFPTGLRVILYVVMGWAGMAAPGTVVQTLGWPNLSWLLAGGAIYTLGAIVFVTDRPRLFPGKFVAHDLWHLMVIAGAACHFVAIYSIVTGRA